jgi:hypothetical protein
MAVVTQNKVSSTLGGKKTAAIALVGVIASSCLMVGGYLIGRDSTQRVPANSSFVTQSHHVSGKAPEAPQLLSVSVDASDSTSMDIQLLARATTVSCSIDSRRASSSVINGRATVVLLVGSSSLVQSASGLCWAERNGQMSSPVHWP